MLIIVMSQKCIQCLKFIVLYYVYCFKKVRSSFFQFVSLSQEVITEIILKATKVLNYEILISTDRNIQLLDLKDRKIQVINYYYEE